jgi:hypothetical protein
MSSNTYILTHLRPPVKKGKSLAQLRRENCLLEERLKKAQEQLKHLYEQQGAILEEPQTTCTIDDLCQPNPKDQLQTDDSTTTFYTSSLIIFRHELKNAALAYAKNKDRDTYLSEVHRVIFKYALAAQCDTQLPPQRSTIQAMLGIYAERALRWKRDSEHLSTDYLMKEASDLATQSLQWYEKLATIQTEQEKPLLGTPKKHI